MEPDYSPDTTTLIDYIRNEVSPDEKAAVEAWACVSAENEKALLDIARIYYARSGLSSGTRWSTEKAYRKVMDRINRRRFTLRIDWRVAAAAVAALFIVNAVLWIMRAPDARDNIVLSSNDEKKVEYTLPDGTVVYLNRNSSLIFPVRYQKRKRCVILDGEAYFNVAHNPHKPFVVTTRNNVEIRVLGTKFNLEAYASDSIVRTSLLEGRISMHIDNGTPRGLKFLMEPNDEICYNTQTDAVVRNSDGKLSGIEWMNNIFVFKDTPLPEVIRQLSHNFGTNFIIEDNELRSYLFTGTFDNRELSLILEYMKISSGIDIRVEHSDSGGDAIVLFRKE